MQTLRHWLKKILVVFWKDISNGAQISWAHLKAIWWLKYLLLTIVAIVALAVWAQGARIAEDPNRFAKWLYAFLDDWAVTLGAAVTFMLAVAAFLAILDNRHGRRVDRRERLLNEIIGWATEIHIASLKIDLPKIDPSLELYIEEKAEGNQEIIEGIKRNIVNKEHYRIEVETLFKYSIPCSRAEYIRALASENFKGQGIIKFVDDIIDNLVALMFLRGMEIGIENPKEGFGESAIVIMNRVEEELKNPVSTIDNLLKKYGKELSESVNALFTDAAKIISNL